MIDKSNVQNEKCAHSINPQSDVAKVTEVDLPDGWIIDCNLSPQVISPIVSEHFLCRLMRY